MICHRTSSVLYYQIIVAGTIVEHESAWCYMFSEPCVVGERTVELWNCGTGRVQCCSHISVRVPDWRVCEVAVLGSGDQVESPLTLSLLSVFCRRSLEAGGR